MPIKFNVNLTAEELRRRYSYDPETGLFMSKAHGRHVGAVNSRGYAELKINSKNYKAHRLAWLYMTGAWPADQIDHINAVRSDNRWINLRAATHSENQQNLRKPRVTNSSGHTGVRWRGEVRKWAADICRNGKRIVRYFDSKQEAIAARLKAEGELFTHAPAHTKGNS